MIGKIGSQPATEYVQIERTIKEPEPQSNESVIAEHPSREAAEQTASARKNEMAITSSTQKAILDSQIQLPKKQTAVAAKQPEPIADSSSTRTLKVGDKGPEVQKLIQDLQDWQKGMHLEQTPSTNGVYTEEIEKAVKEFQIANNLPRTGKADPNTQRRIKLENDPNFRILDSEVKQSIRSSMNICADQPEAQENILKLATDRQFAHLLSKDSQKSAVSGLMMHPSDKQHLNNVQDAVLDVAILEKEKTLDHLPESTKQQAINTIFKKTEDRVPPNFFVRSSETRLAVIDLAKNPQFAALTESQQRRLLDGVAQNPAFAAQSMVNILNSPAYKNMDEKMKAYVVELAAENALYPVHQRIERPGDYERLEGLEKLIDSKKFLESSEDDKWAQLKPYKAPLPNPKPEVDIL